MTMPYPRMQAPAIIAPRTANLLARSSLLFEAAVCVAMLTFAPVPRSTVGTVLNRILRSSASDHFSMYSRSWMIHLSKLVSLRPDICQMHVMPGLTLKRRLNQCLSNRWKSRSGKASADQRQVAQKNVEKLGQFVETRLAEPYAKSCHTRIVLDLENRAVSLVQFFEFCLPSRCVRYHRPELEHTKPTLVLGQTRS